jgi:death-on-curing protein
MVLTLSTPEVLSIYDSLVLDFALSGDPMSPPGIKSMDLLESAVSRQHTGFDGRLKYETAQSNAATLCFGICCNHAFHNGNKRTALVAMLCHLDKNDRTFEEGVTQDELYQAMVRVADHSLGGRHEDADEEVEALSKWIRKRIRIVEKGERNVTCRELRTILERHGFEFDNHDSNHISIYRTRKGMSFFGLGGKPKRELVMRIPYPRHGAQVGKGLLRELRERCEMSLGHGIDAKAFYTNSRPPDYFIARYSKTLQRLAKT